MELSERIKELVIDALKQADGEDIQEILMGSGWSDQMLRQLMMTESISDIKHLYKERLALEDEFDKRKYWVFESC